jgi:hypothetical protein
MDNVADQQSAAAAPDDGWMAGQIQRREAGLPVRAPELRLTRAGWERFEAEVKLISGLRAKYDTDTEAGLEQFVGELSAYTGSR